MAFLPLSGGGGGYLIYELSCLLPVSGGGRSLEVLPQHPIEGGGGRGTIPSGEAGGAGRSVNLLLAAFPLPTCYLPGDK